MAEQDLSDGGGELYFQLAAGSSGRHVFGGWRVPDNKSGGSRDSDRPDTLFVQLLSTSDVAGTLTIQHANAHSDVESEADRLYHDAGEADLDDETQSLQVTGIGGRYVRVVLELDTALAAAAGVAVRMT